MPKTIGFSIRRNATPMMNLACAESAPAAISASCTELHRLRNRTFLVPTIGTSIAYGGAEGAQVRGTTRLRRPTRRLVVGGADASLAATFAQVTPAR